MKGRLFALLVHDHPFPLESLKQILKDLSVDTYSVCTCSEAESLLTQTEPSLVFTDLSVSDGSWVNIVNLAERAEAPTNVIVVGASLDLRLHKSVTEGGAFAFIAPPFERESLSLVVRSAELDTRTRREVLTRAA